MITRSLYINAISIALKRSPITALLGPRQCGKTTLAKIFAEQGESHYFDLEAPSDRQRLQNPELMLTKLSGLVILDEIQLFPELFSILRVLVDREEHQTRYLILGSASPQIIKKVSETLAGRIEFVELSGFNLSELPTTDSDKLWLRGGFPRSILSANEIDSAAWREGFIRTFLERDIPQLGISIAPMAMRRFWTMLAHLHGQTWNASELGRSMSLNDKTVRGYLDLLTGTYMLRQLQPWYENIKKRQVKAPKVYLRDSGILHSLLNITTQYELSGHPRLGASWEGFALEQVLSVLRPIEAYFWSTYSGAALDLFFFSRGTRFGIEFKYNEAPGMSKSIYSALNDLNLEHLWIIYPGNQSYPIHEKVTVLSKSDILTLPDKLNSTRGNR